MSYIFKLYILFEVRHVFLLDMTFVQSHHYILYHTLPCNSFVYMYLNSNFHWCLKVWFQACDTGWSRCYDTGCSECFKKRYGQLRFNSWPSLTTQCLYTWSKKCCPSKSINHKWWLYSIIMCVIMDILGGSNLAFDNHRSAAQRSDLEKRRNCPCLPKGTCRCRCTRAAL